MVVEAVLMSVIFSIKAVRFLIKKFQVYEVS